MKRRKNILKEAGVLLLATIMIITTFSVANPTIDTTPPVTHCSYTGELVGGVYISDVTVTITATDNESGVNYTYYDLDNGGWNVYTAPFVVSDYGMHVLKCYSVDKAENIEAWHYCNFTIKQKLIGEIEITGGLGLSTTIKNTGTITYTNITVVVNVTGQNMLYVSSHGYNRGQIEKRVRLTSPLPPLDIGAAKIWPPNGIILGVGNINIRAYATCDQGTTSYTNATAMLLLFYILMAQ